MTRKEKAVIFDMDGVLIDSEKLWQQAEREIFSSVGVQVTDEYSALTKSMTTSEVTKFWFEKFPWQNINVNTVEQMVISRVIHLIETEHCEIVGIKQFIEKLKAKNYRIGLATNSPHKIIPVVLKKINALHLFDSVSSAEFEEKGKPHPAIYVNTAAKLNVAAINCIAIEDSYSGMAAARQAGMRVVAFSNGNSELKFDIADDQIDRFDEAAIRRFN